MSFVMKEKNQGIKRWEKNVGLFLLMSHGGFQIFFLNSFYGSGSGLVGNTSWHNWRNTDLLRKKERNQLFILDWKWPKKWQHHHKFLAVGKWMSVYVGRDGVRKERQTEIERERERWDWKKLIIWKFSELKTTQTNFHEKTNITKRKTKRKTKQKGRRRQNVKHKSRPYTITVQFVYKNKETIDRDVTRCSIM